MATRTKSTAALKVAAPKSTPAAPKRAPAATPARSTTPPSAPPSAAPKAVAAQKPTAPAGPVAPAPSVTERARRGDLLDAMDDRSPMRRADLKVVMELMLEEMGKMLDSGDELVLPPLGKLSVKKRVERGGGDMLTVKLKRLPENGLSEDTDS